MPSLVLAGLPLLGLAGLGLWRKARSDLVSLAYVDDLTGLGNRRAFLLRTRQKLARARPGELALVLLDVDGLKQVNDSCGHQAGDELLTLAAASLARIPGDVYRLGGDEFAILVDRSEGAGVTSVLRQLTPLTATFETCGHQHRVQVSYGYASNSAETSLDSLYREADIRLRDLKRRLYATGGLADRRRRLPRPDLAELEQTIAAPDGLAPVLSLESKRRGARGRSVS
jgi:diguanylate cyclase (GGDEF)-like protein